MARIPYIPENITVHLGTPSSDAQNVTVPFAEYIANVASSEIYPTWPESAIRANIYAQISYALNRIYTEYYRARGYDFDITNSTSIDQSFVYGRDIFDNISDIVGEIFNDYIRRQGSIEPLFAQYCDGIEVTCSGLSQWGSVTLAEEGLVPYEILTSYYGNNIEIVRDAPVQGITSSYPNEALSLGDVGSDVRQIQIRLNRIADNYPSIPKIARADGIFSYDTDSAVRTFQEVFGLTPDGIVGKATWYKIQLIYNSVKRLNELNSEGISQDDISDISYPLPEFGETSLGVGNLQYYLNYLSQFYSTISPVAVDNIFGNATRAAVEAAQSTFGLPVTGVVDKETWDAIFDAYRGIVNTISYTFTNGNVLPFPGIILRVGSESGTVALLQEYLNYIASEYPEIPTLPVTGYFGGMTESAVIAFQQLFGLPENGIVDATVWDEIATVYKELYNRSNLNDGQYPGYSIGG